MNNSLRITTILIALLIAGKEILALGSALGVSDDVCRSHCETAANEQWVLENEAEEEAEERVNLVLGISETSIFNSNLIAFLNAGLNSSTSLSEFKFLVRYPEFYIYVLNLRL